MTPGDDEQATNLIVRLGKLYTPVLADVLDRLNCRNQSLRADVRPLFPSARIAGYALTVQTILAPEIAPAEPYKGELEAVDALGPLDVMVVSSCDWSFWGELLSTAALYRGCRGIIIDGFTRDTTAIIKMEFPTFCRGIHPADSLGRIDVAAHNVPILCGGVLVNAADLILADADGVVVVPRAVAVEAIELAEEKIRSENLVRAKLAEGMSVTEAFRRYGVL
jgi:4-hydroxy-4-methyl-2-oxoglutarate aldolase